MSENEKPLSAEEAETWEAALKETSGISYPHDTARLFATIRAKDAEITYYKHQETRSSAAIDYINASYGALESQNAKLREALEQARDWAHRIAHDERVTGWVHGTDYGLYCLLADPDVDFEAALTLKPHPAADEEAAYVKNADNIAPKLFESIDGAVDDTAAEDTFGERDVCSNCGKATRYSRLLNDSFHIKGEDFANADCTRPKKNESYLSGTVLLPTEIKELRKILAETAGKDTLRQPEASKPAMEVAKAITQLPNYEGRISFRAWQREIAHMLDERMPSQEWTYVKDRLPDMDDGNKHGKVLWIDLDGYCTIGDWDLLLQRRKGRLYAWMSLPSLPNLTKLTDAEIKAKVEKTMANPAPLNVLRDAAKHGIGPGSEG